MSRDFKYNFKNFNPDENTRSYVAQIAEDLYFASPSDSGLNLVIEKTKNAVRASCRIVSLAGIFTAEAVCNDVMDAVDQVHEKINQQLKSWKLQRFAKAPAPSRDHTQLAS